MPPDANPPHFYPTPMSISSHWHRHPSVRSGEQLTIGERAADSMLNRMGSWAFVLGALLLLSGW